jgi:putative ABC transport system permease protein
MKLWNRIRYLLNRDRFDRELQEEMGIHREMAEEKLSQSGSPQEEARYDAMTAFGNNTLALQDSRAVWGSFLETIAQDIRFGVRMLLKNALFSMVAITILALGIGANVAIFSVVNGMLLRPLPYLRAEQLVHFSWLFGRNAEVPSVSAPEFLFWQDNSRSFDSVASYDLFASGANLSTSSTPQFVHLLDVTQQFFPTLGVEPLFGRNFTQEECKAGGPGAAILSYGLWQGKFGGDAGVIGRVIGVDGKAATVVGVLPRTFEFATSADLWLALRLEFNAADDGHNYLMIGRLRSGVTLAQAQAEMPAVFHTFQSLYPKVNNSAEQGMRVGSYQTWLVGWVRTSLLVLFGAVALVLLIAMVNVSSLLLAKASARGKEMAIRAALGAGRLRLLCQLTVESLILAMLGGAAGLLVASATLRAIIATSPRTLPALPFSPFIGFTQQIGLNGMVISFTVAVAVLIGCIVGLIASLRATRVDVNAALKQSAASHSYGGARHRAHYALVTAEIAFSAILLSGALLLIRSLDMLQRVPLGFDPDHLWSVEFNMPLTRYATAKASWQFERQIMGRLESLPGVTEVAGTSALPLEQVMNTWIYRPDQDPHKGVSEQYYAVTPTYFQTLRIALRKGRVFTEADAAGAEPVVVVNEVVARYFWKDSNPVGQLLHVAERAAPVRRIIGVVANTKQLELGEDPQPAIFVPEAQLPDEFTGLSGSALQGALLVRAQSPPDLLTVQQIFAEADPTIAVAHYRSVEDVISESITPQKFETGALAVLASLALVLSGIGIYAVLAYLLSQRTHEVGIRMALGAAPRQVLLLALRQGMAPVLVGALLGLGGAAAATRLMSTLLFGITPGDPITFAAVVAILAVVALFACYIPARRAARVDPMVALRHE